jgi:hypothetical protein
VEHRDPVRSPMMAGAVTAVVLAAAYIALWVRQSMPDNAWRKPSGRK